jgi:hypothetical protein
MGMRIGRDAADMGAVRGDSESEEEMNAEGVKPSLQTCG